MTTLDFPSDLNNYSHPKNIKTLITSPYGREIYVEIQLLEKLTVLS
jgi:hypothetical protein